MERIGWIGTGVMGANMSARLLAAGHPVTVTTRTPAKAELLLAAGASWAASPAAVAAASDVVFTMVGYPSEVEEVVLGPEGGALDAPVSGGDVGARNGTLSIMVGGEAPTYERVRPLLDAMGTTIVHQGPAGAGQHAKLTNQIVVAGNLIAMCEALLYATRAGLDIETVLASISGGAASSWALHNLAPRVVAGDYAPGFFVDHFVKDLAIVLHEAARLRLALPGLALVHQLAVALQAQGHGRDGTQSLIKALEALSPAG